MKITKDTKLRDIVKEYPWLIDEAIKIDPGFKQLNSPLGKVLIKTADIAGLSKRAGLPAEEIISKIKELIDAH